MYEIYYSPAFLKKFKRLIKKNPQLKQKVNRTTKILLQNPKSFTIRLHKLSGRNNWSISVTRDIRIIMSIRGGMILFSDLGKHNDIY